MKFKNKLFVKICNLFASENHSDSNNQADNDEFIGADPVLLSLLECIKATPTAELDWDIPATGERMIQRRDEQFRFREYDTGSPKWLVTIKTSNDSHSFLSVGVEETTSNNIVVSVIYKLLNRKAHEQVESTLKTIKEEQSKKQENLLDE